MSLSPCLHWKPLLECVSRTRLKFLPSPPRKGRRGWTVGHVLSLPYSLLEQRKEGHEGPFALPGTFIRTIPHSLCPSFAGQIPPSHLSPFQAIANPSQVLPVGASCPPGRLLPSFSARAVLQPAFAELSACVQLLAFGQLGDASPTHSTKGPMSHTASQKLLLRL